jgi:hypothetical protein
MSERARRVLCWCAAGAVTLAGLTAPAAAQHDAASLERRLDTATTRLAAARSAWEAENARRRAAIPTDTLRAAGIRVLLRAEGPSAIERTNIADGIERAVHELRTRHGPSSVALLDTVGWSVEGSRSWRTGRFTVLQEVFFGQGMQGLQPLRRPVDPLQVRDILLDRAGHNIARAVPALRFAGNDVSLNATQTAFEEAGREMAMAWSSTARRCSAGSLEHCRRLLVDPPEGQALAWWYEPPDHRAVVVARSGEIAKDDAARWTMRRRCMEGDAAQCTALAETMKAPFPLTAHVRGTFVEHALDIGPAGTFERLQADTATTDVPAMLARATGVPADSLIMGSRRRRGAS